MVPRGLEPRTFRLLAERFNQLSYETSAEACLAQCVAFPGALGGSANAPPWPHGHGVGFLIRRLRGSRPAEGGLLFGFSLLENQTWRE